MGSSVPSSPAGQYPLCTHLPIALSAPTQGTAREPQNLSTKWPTVSSSPTKILYALLNHPKRAIHPLHFTVTCAIFCTLLLPPPQPSQSTNLHSPLFPRLLKLFSTKLHSTPVQSVLRLPVSSTAISITAAQYTLRVSTRSSRL